jgi:hypothetical protein
MGKFAFLFASMLFIGVLPQEAFAQKKSQVCTSTGCHCYETWSDYWDQTYQTCMEESGRQIPPLPYGERNRDCGGVANDAKARRAVELGTSADILTQFREVACETTPADPETAPTTLAQEPNQPQHVTPPACIAEVSEAARACRNAQKAATASCDPANNQALNNADSEGKDLSGSLENQKNMNNTCGETSQYQGTMQSALGNYTQACNSGRESCNTSCSAAQEAANRCRNEATRAPSSEIAEDVQTCSESGPLAQKAQQATQQSQAQGQTQEDADKCQTASAASPSQKANGDGPLSQEAGETPTGSLPTGGASAGRGDNPVSPMGTPGSNYNTSGSLQNLNDDGSGKVDDGNHGPSPKFPNSMSSLGGMLTAAADALGALPSRGPASDVEASPSTSDSATTTDSGSSRGGGGRRIYRAPRTAAERELLMKDPEKAKAMGLAWPDLNRFRPNMAGMRGGSGFDGHGKHVNIFEKIHERYVHIEETLFRAAAP